MRILAGDFFREGYALLEYDFAYDIVCLLQKKFSRSYLPKFSTDADRNRSIIKLFAEELPVKRFFSSTVLEKILIEYLEIADPVQTGPVVTHYTSQDLTGNNFGLPYHQDWPSMGTSTRGVIVWTSITDVTHSDPGITIIPGSHCEGLLPGHQTDRGWVLHEQKIPEQLDIEASAGQILLMSPWLVHKTRLPPNNSENWKLSLSCRFDDLSCLNWDRRNFISAYRTVVDRNAYTK